MASAFYRLTILLACHFSISDQFFLCLDWVLSALQPSLEVDGVFWRTLKWFGSISRFPEYYTIVARSVLETWVSHLVYSGLGFHPFWLLYCWLLSLDGIIWSFEGFSIGMHIEEVQSVVRDSTVIDKGYCLSSGKQMSLERLKLGFFIVDCLNWLF